MKIIGTNKYVTLTAEKAKYWIEHQANQRTAIVRHVNGLAKLLARVGWRNDQRICITEDDRIINGLQRLSALIKIGDFGWKIPVTVFSNDELTHDLIESFNVQKSDCLYNLMRREYLWRDKRMTSICAGIWEIINCKQNITTCDALAIYEGLKSYFDIILTVTELKVRGARKIPTDVNIAAILCGLDGLSLDRFLLIARDYINDDRSSEFWKALRNWDMEWRTHVDKNGKNITREPGDRATHIAVRYLILKDFICEKKIKQIKSITEEESRTANAHVREMIKNNI